MPVKTYQDLVKREVDGYWHTQRMYGEVSSTTTSTVISVDLLAIQRMMDTITMINPLPSGVTGYILSRIYGLACSTSSIGVIIAKAIDMGNINIGTNVFTDGSSMPTETCLGVSKKLASPIFMEVTTALNATPGSLTLTYKDQDDNTAESTSAMTLTASVASQSTGIAILNTGDYAATDITNAVQSGGTTPSGVIKFWGLIPLYIGPCGYNTAQVGIDVNTLTDNISTFNIYNGDVIKCFIMGSTAAKSSRGMLKFIGNN